MLHLNYLWVLIFIALCAIGVNLGFKLKISQHWRTFFKVDLCILVIYLAWDIWAVHKKSWSFDSKQILGLKILGGLPIEDILFFVVVPLMAILSYRALTQIVARFRR